MQSIKHWEEKIKEKRKQTPWREFLKEIASWFPVNLYKNNNLISRYPLLGRINIKSTKEYEEEREKYTKYGKDYDFEKDFFTHFQSLKKEVPFPALTTY